MRTVIGNDGEEMRRILFIAALLVSFVSAYGETYSGDGIVLRFEGDSIWVNGIGMNRSDLSEIFGIFRTKMLTA